MSKKNEVHTQADTAVALSHVEPETPATAPTPDNPVMVAEEYVFGAYRPGHERRLSLDIGHLFAKGFDPTPYNFQWVKYNELQDAPARYLTKVTKTLHGKWFKPEVFHGQSGCITRGNVRDDYGNQAELYLHVRTKAAAQNEQQAMLDAVEAKRNPSGGDVDATIQGIGKAIGSQYLSGGITRSAWGPK